MKNYKTFKLILSGRVQGVGFRYFAEDRANIFNIKGYVRNMINNKLEILCQGCQRNVDLFVMEMKKGPALAHVREVQVEELQEYEFLESFEIKY